MALTNAGILNRKFDCLATQLGVANTHFYFYKKLRDAQQHEFQNEFYKSRDFWNYTTSGHIQAAVLHLCRVYDDRAKHPIEDRDAFHLLRFVEEIPEVKLTDQEKDLLKNDSKFLQKKFPDSKVRKLRKWRHSLIAHQNVSLLLGQPEDFWKVYPVDFEEIQQLIDTGFLILERWASYYKPELKLVSPKVHYSIKKFVSGKDDYLFVLESMRWGLRQCATKR